MELIHNDFKNIKIKYSEQAINRIGLQALRLIRKRTLSGLDAEDKPFKPYSTKALSMPSGWFRKMHLKELVKAKEAFYFKDKNGSLKVLIKGGYFSYKTAVMKRLGGTANTVNLSLTGAMLRGMQVISTDNNSLQIGWGNINLALRTKGNIDRGRNFLGLSPNDLKDSTLLSLLADGIMFE